MLELNMWCSATTLNFYGNLNIDKKSSVENFSKLIPIAEFCELRITNKNLTIDELTTWIQDPERDHDALYAWTSGGSIIGWNVKCKSAYVRYQGKDFTLQQNKRDISTRKGAPDLFFRG